MPLDFFWPRCWRGPGSSSSSLDESMTGVGSSWGWRFDFLSAIFLLCNSDLGILFMGAVVVGAVDCYLAFVL